MSKESCSPRDWCLLIRDRRWSLRQKHELLERFKCPGAIFSASLKELRRSISGRQSSRLAQVIEDDIRVDLEWLSHPEHHLVSINDRRYPELLKQLPDPPIALFAIGDLSLLSKPQVAIVGTRRPTPIGAAIADKIAARLAELGIVVTSGMALGIDGIAHTGALRVGGLSVAVLGSGLDMITPARHTRLFNLLSNKGLLLSEYPLGYPATRYTFPERNRIVSGLSLGVVIVEAAERSGTLITARLAAEQNRELMVVPGSALSAQYQGSHALIQQGAALVADADDVLHCLSGELGAVLDGHDQAHYENPAQNKTHNYDGLLQHIGAESTSVDDIILASGLTAAEVSSILITLEIEGVVAASSDGGYINLC